MVRKQVKALTVLYLVPYQHFGVDFAPYQILLVMGAVFVLLAIPFLLFYDRRSNSAAPMQQMPAAAQARAKDIGNPTSMSARMAAILCSGSTISPEP